MGRHQTVLGVMLVFLAGMGMNGQPAPAQPFQLSINVDLVVLQATVRDHKGGFASGLNKDDFEVYEDGVRQSIQLFQHEDVPVTVGLVVDHSGSMRNKLADVIAAMRTFVHASSGEDEMFVVNFNEKVTLGLPEAMGVSNRADDLASAIARSPVTGRTALYDAVLTAMEVLRSGKHEKKVLVVISDGGDNASSHTLAQVLRQADESSVLAYTVGIFDDDDPDKNIEVLRHIARATGGEAFFPRQVSDVVATCERIAHDIRNQYTIGYVSSNASGPGSHHDIRLTAHASGRGRLSAHTRSGYVAGGDALPVKSEAVK